MTHKEVVCAIKPRACIEKIENGWLVREHPEGRILGSAKFAVQAWQSARMKLFNENINIILSTIPVTTK